MNLGFGGILNRIKTFAKFEKLAILDVGCGFGDLLLALDNDGSANLIVGVDSDVLWASAARMRTSKKTIGVYNAEGERLPFSDNSFDGVISHQVLEHVDDLDNVLSEMLRVCAPGGWCSISGPNYLLPYEPHYRVPLIPWLPKSLASWWLKRIGRDPTYFKHSINFVNPFKVIRKLRKIGIASEINIMQQCIANPNNENPLSI